jgi:cytidylate kinase
MKHMVISIGVEYGSGGIAIGKKLAEKLGIVCYDRDLIDEILEEVGISKNLIEMSESGVDLKGRNIERSAVGSPGNYANLTQRMIHVQSEVIKKLADRESCVIIGRSSDYILKDRDDCLSIFIYAPEEVRIKTMMKNHNLSEEDARLIVSENEKTLRARYEQMTGTYQGDRHTRHLLIDSSVLGWDGTAEFIEAFVRRRFGIK